MPKGLYSHHDPHSHALTGFERFSCAPGPSGWRYVAALLAPDALTEVGVLDLTIDQQGRTVRLELRRGSWRLRGGQVGPRLRWVRMPVEPGLAAGESAGSAQEWSEFASGFFGSSPAFTVAAARQLAAAGGSGPQTLRHVHLTEPVLAARTADASWTVAGVDQHETPSGPLTVNRYEVVDITTAERSVLHLAGDVMLAGPGIELEDLSDPPNQ